MPVACFKLGMSPVVTRTCGSKGCDLHVFYSQGCNSAWGFFGALSKSKKDTNHSISTNKSIYLCHVSPPSFSPQRHHARGIFGLNHPHFIISSGIPPPTAALSCELDALWKLGCFFIPPEHEEQLSCAVTKP